MTEKKKSKKMHRSSAKQQQQNGGDTKLPGIPVQIHNEDLKSNYHDRMFLGTASTHDGPTDSIAANSGIQTVG